MIDELGHTPTLNARPFVVFYRKEEQILQKKSIYEITVTKKT
jgi:hypothetical protein